MRNKSLIFVLVFCASIFSNKIDAQSQYAIDIDAQLNHDTITYGQSFDILVFQFQYIQGLSFYLLTKR